MKKYLVIVLLALFVITGCGSKKEEDKKPNDNGVVVFYKSYPMHGTVESMENYYYVELSTDKKLKTGYANTDKIEEKYLTDEKYNEIIDYAFSKKFISLSKDISDNMVADGTRSSIIIYYSDGTSFTTGGANPNNKVYNKLVYLLNQD